MGLTDPGDEMPELEKTRDLVTLTINGYSIKAINSIIERSIEPISRIDRTKDGVWEIEVIGFFKEDPEDKKDLK